jgi:hypothetical protein
MRGSIGLLSCAWAAEIFRDRERQARAEHVAPVFGNVTRVVAMASRRSRQPGGFAAPPGFGERIGLDPRTHEPVADRMYYEGKISSEALVLERKPDIAAGKFSFVVPNPTRGVSARSRPPSCPARGSIPHALRARRALGQRPLWLGERFDGIRLQAVTIGSTFDPPPVSARRRHGTFSTTTETSRSASSMPATCGGPGKLLFLVA